MINAITPVLPVTAKAGGGAENPQDRDANARPEVTNGAAAVARSSAPGTTVLDRAAPITAPEAVTRSDAPPRARPGEHTLSLPTRADAQSIIMAIASDRDPQIYGPEADMAAEHAASERARIMSRAQAIVEAVMAQDTGVAQQDPYSAAKSGRHI